MNFRFFILFLCFVVFSTDSLSGQEVKDIPQTQTLEDGTKKKKKKKKLDLDFSLKGGFYNETIEVELISPGTKIYYTIDGSTPNSKATTVFSQAN